jgi:acyl-CoA synthetase (AMP-forming)/AMP-acid ligase II
MFIVGGFNAYPAEIENILCDHPAISQAAVIGIEDERMGEVAKAFIILKPEQSLTSDSLIEWSKENMANYKVPREIDFVDDLPTNAAGKIMKYLLREKP